VKKQTARELYSALERFYFAERPGWGRDKFTATVRRNLRERVVRRLLKMEEPSPDKKRALLSAHRNVASLTLEICRDFPLMAPEIAKSLWQFVAHGRRRSLSLLRDAMKEFSKKLPHGPAGGRPRAFKTFEEQKQLYDQFKGLETMGGMSRPDALNFLGKTYGVNARTIRRVCANFDRSSS
jgi:hypothetical protein